MKQFSLTCALLAYGLSQAFPALAHGDGTHEDSAQARFESLVALFETADIVGKPAIVPCTLSGGTKTTCFSITTVAAPADHTTGPFCPRTITDTASQAGTWFKDGEVYDVDGSFIQRLAEIYDDDQWQMYDPETGKVTVAEGTLGCEVAGDPTSADRYKNYCVECELQNMPAEVTQTYVIPLHPTDASGNGEPIGHFSGIGLALNGAKFDAPAPLDLILGGHTLGPFDDCGGHVNPHSGYHYHGVVGCGRQVDAEVQDHAPIIGVAMDGYTMHARTDANDQEPDDLDACRGHETEGLGYHYHVNAPGKNQIIGCFKAEIGCRLDDPAGTCDASIAPERPAGPGRPERP